MAAPLVKCPRCREFVAVKASTPPVIAGHGFPYGGHCPGSGSPVTPAK